MIIVSLTRCALSVEATKDAFAGALQEAAPALRAHLRHKLARPETADDAVQETFLRMMRYRHINDVGEIHALLFRVAGSVVADHYRHVKARRDADHRPLDETELTSMIPSPDRILLGQDAFAHVKQAIGTLPPRCRQVFLMHRFEGLSYREIAEHFGTSTRTVENQIAHALVVCRRAVGGNPHKTV